jgi:hypothetical protein
MCPQSRTKVFHKVIGDQLVPARDLSKVGAQVAWWAWLWAFPAIREAKS